MRFHSRLEWQVKCLKKSKKIILFLVEGITDETTFGLILSKLSSDNYVVRFHVIGGDLTTQNGSTRNNCITKVVDEVKIFLQNDIYQKSDIQEIVHLVDLDGTFISSENVVYDPTKLSQEQHIFYTADCIITDHIGNICKRNVKKAEILDKLYLEKEIYGKIPYQVYFFSCNMEHVLYNQQNPNDKTKYTFAKETEMKFANDPKLFLDYMNSPEIAKSGDYMETWKIVKSDVESLHRQSNFHLFLNRISDKA